MRTLKASEVNMDLKEKCLIILYKICFFFGLSFITFIFSFVIALYHSVDYPEVDYRVGTLLLFTLIECCHVFWLAVMNFFSYEKRLS